MFAVSLTVQASSLLALTVQGSGRHNVLQSDAQSIGALSLTFDRALRALGKHARAPTTHDSTRYGLSRSSPQTFLVAHTIARLLRGLPLRGYLGSRRSRGRNYHILLAAPAMSFKLTSS